MCWGNGMDDIEKIVFLKLQIMKTKKKLIQLYEEDAASDENVLRLVYRLKVLNEKYEKLISNNKSEE